MSQMGSGAGSSYPDAIDTRQTFINSPMAAPDSASRLDAEVVNDSLHALVQIETALGAKPNGDFASLAARLQQFIPGGGESPLYFGFTASTSVTIPGTTHHLGTASPLVQVYDNASPRNSIEPNTVEIDPTTFDILVTFATPQSGVVSVANPVPQYTTSFSSVSSVTVPGTTHLLGTALLFVSVYALIGGKQVRQAGAITIHPSTFDVVVTFGTPQSGEICISAAGPRYATTFISQTTVTILGSTHGLETAALLWQLYNAATPLALISPNTLTVDPSTFNVVFTFVTPQSGTILLVGATGITGHDFQVRDRGVTNVNAVRVYSNLGTLNLQMGSGNACVIRNPTGAQVGLVDDLGNAAFAQNMLIGSNLEIGGTATKPGGGPWLAPSDIALKKDITPFTDGLAQILALLPVWYTYNGLGGLRADGQRHSGFIAQDVEPVAPYMVRHTQGKLHATDATPVALLQLDTEAMIPLLVNAIQELSRRVQDLEARLAARTPEEGP